MTNRLNPYLSFAGDASAALAFYQDVFGGDLTINHFGDFGTDDHGIGDQVMHGRLETASGLTLMALTCCRARRCGPGTTSRSASAGTTPRNCAASGRRCRTEGP